MITKAMQRCNDCGYLDVDENGNWICEYCEAEIHQVSDDECPEEE